MNSNNRFAGLRSLFLMENDKWMRNYSWLKTLLVWTFVTNGLLLFVFTQSSMFGATPTVQMSYEILIQLFSSAYPVGVIIMVHGAIVSEKENGVTSWVLSSPVSRLSLILSKLGANLIYIISIALVFQSLISQQLIQYFTGEAINATQYYLGIIQVALYVTYWIAFTTMLSVVFNKRGTVLGAAFMVMFFQDLIVKFVAMVLPFFPRLMSGALLNSIVSTMYGGPVSVEANLVIVVWIIAFILAAYQRFEGEEL